MNWTNDDDSALWLVRHGESTWNALGLVQGHAEGPTLTEKGRQQSAQAADRLWGGTIEAIYASDLVRAQQTAAFVGTALGLPVRYDRALRERCFGVLEGLPMSTLDPGDSGISGDSVVDVSARPEGGESLDELYKRAGTFLEWLLVQQHTGDVVVVTHGGTIRALRAYCSGMPMSGMAWDVVPNGSVWKVPQLGIAKVSKW